MGDHELLFHYTTASAAVESILPTGRLRLGLFEFTNDPRESKEWHMSASIAEGVEFEPDALESLSTEADRLLRRAVKLGCFTQDADPQSDLDVVSGRGFGHSRLWSQYAGNHSGVCIGFDRRALLETLQDQLAPLGTSFHGAVEYLSDPSPPYEATHFDVEQVDEFGLDALVARNLSQHWKRLFFTKDADWETEREYRWVFVNPDPIPVFVDVSSCIRMVVLGDGFAVNRLPAVQHVTDAMSNIIVAQIRYVTGRPLLLPAPPIAERVERPHRRSGDLGARTAALLAAEEAASDARVEAERFAAQALAALQDTVKRCALRLRSLANVDVQLHSSGFAAVPLKERQRAAGVARGEVVYSAGLMCVVENQPQYSFTLVCAVAAQVLTDSRLRCHATFQSERWRRDGNERKEIWRGRREVGSKEPQATESARELGAELEQQLEHVVVEYEDLRSAG